ncbi:unnamed protein product [Arctogadus glacialis]
MKEGKRGSTSWCKGSPGNEKTDFTDSLRILESGFGSEESLSSEAVAIQKRGPESGEPSENRTLNTNAKVDSKGRKEETANSEQSSSSILQTKQQPVQQRLQIKRAK